MASNELIFYYLIIGSRRVRVMAVDFNVPNDIPTGRTHVWINFVILFKTCVNYAAERIRVGCADQIDQGKVVGGHAHENFAYVGPVLSAHCQSGMIGCSVTVRGLRRRSHTRLAGNIPLSLGRNIGLRTVIRYAVTYTKIALKYDYILEQIGD